MVSENLLEKLAPLRFPCMSPKMMAIMGVILGKAYTRPSLVELCILSDGGFLGRTEGDIGLNEFLGHVDDLTRNWENLLNAADLTPQERSEAESLFTANIKDWRMANANR